jgi:hypothetical protein
MRISSILHTLLIVLAAAFILILAGCGGSPPSSTSTASPAAVQTKPATAGTESPGATAEPSKVVAGPHDFGDRARITKAGEGKLDFVHKHSGLSVVYPMGWKAELTPNQDGVVLTNDKLPGVVIKSFSFSRGDKTMEAELGKLEMGDTLKRIGKDEKVKLSGREGLRRMYLKTENPNTPDQKEFKVLGTYFSKKSDVYVVLCYGPKETFDKSLPVFKAVSNSLTIRSVIPVAPFKPQEGAAPAPPKAAQPEAPKAGGKPEPARAAQPEAQEGAAPAPPKAAQPEAPKTAGKPEPPKAAGKPEPAKTAAKPEPAKAAEKP